MLYPENIALIGDEVAIKWEDGSEDFFSMERLRAHSPSAENQGERDLLGNQYGGTEQDKFPGVSVTGWDIVGSYAVQFKFSDGHNSGLYSYDYLKKLADNS
ncbi:MAG: DUF971 domain-containing protein [Verrucomicrobiota bacterium]